MTGRPFHRTTSLWRNLGGSACCVLLAVGAPSARAQTAASAPPEHQHAHVHGTAKLGVAIQDQTVNLSLEAPLDSLIGFEHRAGNPAQQALVDALRSRMRAPMDLFRFDSSAGCTLTRSDPRSALFELKPARNGSDEHADLDADIEFRCARPERLTMLDIGLFAVYPKLMRLSVDVATGEGQFSRDLMRPQHTVSLRK